jgi:hypothetical protein
MEPVIPDFAGKTVLIAKIDYGFYLWTADNWEIRLAVSVVVSAAGTQPVEIEVDVPDSRFRRSWTWSEQPSLSCSWQRTVTWGYNSPTVSSSHA